MDLNTDSKKDSNTHSQKDSSTHSNTDSNKDSNTDSNTDSNPDSNTDSKNDSNTDSNKDNNTDFAPTPLMGERGRGGGPIGGEGVRRGGGNDEGGGTGLMKRSYLVHLLEEDLLILSNLPPCSRENSDSHSVTS